MNIRATHIVVVTAILFCVPQLVAQKVEPPAAETLQEKIEAELRARCLKRDGALDIDLMMLGETYCGTPPSRPEFSLDGQWLRFRWRGDGREGGTWVLNLKDRSLRRLKKDEDGPPSHRRAIHRRDGTLSAWQTDRGLKIFDHSRGEEQILVADDTRRQLAGFSTGGEILFWVGDRLKRIDPRTRMVTQLCRLEVEAKKSGKEKSPQRTFLEEEEKTLLRHVREEVARAQKQKERNRSPQAFATLRYPRGYSIWGRRVSMDGNWIALTLVKRRRGQSTDVPHYVTTSAYVESQSARAKVGDGSFAARVFLGMVGDESAGEVVFPGWDKPFSASVRGFSPDSRRLLVVLRARDNKRAAIFVVSMDDRRPHLIHEVRDEAWIRHVGDHGGFLPDGSCWFTSEKSGFNHLYREKAPGSGVVALTSGSWLIDDLELDEVRQRFLLTTSRHSAHERRLEALPFSGGSLETLTRTAGWHEARISPDGVWLVDIHSRSNRPPELFLRRVADDPDMPGEQITDSPSPAFKAHAWYEPEIVRFPASDGAMVPMRLYRPEQGLKGAPLIVFVHGAGYLQNVLDGWSPYYREYMFHNLLRERGFAVADVDYRGSAGYGRDWRCAIYRHMGGRDLEDQVDAVSWLVKKHGIDRRRVGLYGGSYGGFITLMAMFKKGEVFRCGAALRPVTDWAHYNHGYTANILNTPAEDPEAYRRSSPIYFAQGLKGALLICHGLVDDNVHAQDSLRLAQRLIELRRTNWELALFPVEAHGFRDPASWADEYKRIWRLFSRELTGESSKDPGRGR